MSRYRILESSFQKVAREPLSSLLGDYRIKFEGEEGIDAGGLKREWITLLCRDLFNPDALLFSYSAVDNLTFQPNYNSSLQGPEHLNYFRFAGRICALAMYWEVPLDVHFTRSMYKLMLNDPLTLGDLESVDQTLFNSLRYMMENDITDVFFGTTFTVTRDNFGATTEVELVPGGKNIELTEQNKMIFVNASAIDKMYISVQQQVDAFLEGFHEIIPVEFISFFTANELELQMCGVSEIDVDDWKRNTEYRSLNPNSQESRWFWEIMREVSNEKRAKVLQFATGTAVVPVGGFAYLQGSAGNLRKFELYGASGHIPRDGLPNAHTCFNQLVIPEYSSKHKMKEQLDIAIEFGAAGFGQA